jgi:hypothetical protein
MSARFSFPVAIMTQAVGTAVLQCPGGPPPASETGSASPLKLVHYPIIQESDRSGGASRAHADTYRLWKTRIMVSASTWSEGWELELVRQTSPGNPLAAVLQSLTLPF